MKTLVLHFARFGPYHLARLKSARDSLGRFGWQVRGLQVCSSDGTYDWEDPTSAASLLAAGLPADCIDTLFLARAYEAIRPTEIRARLSEALDRSSPDAIAIAGWASKDALACLSWCRRHDRSAILMSETRWQDGQRVWWKELLKSRRVRKFDAALVGGAAHRDYLTHLGLPAPQIETGYNVVDNGYFTAETAAIRHSRSQPLPEAAPFFLTSNRFVPIKNLAGAVEAYRRYVEQAFRNPNGQQRPWDLCLLGDGPLRETLIAAAKEAGLSVRHAAPWEEERFTSDRPPTVYFPGFRQIDQLPLFYAHAGAFLHTATAEPWGLVINEAMASSLPIVSSTNVAAAEELVDVGINGFLFDPASPGEMADAIGRLSQLDPSARAAMGEASLRIVNERAPTSAFGNGLANILQGLNLHQ